MYISTPKIEQYDGTGSRVNETFGIVRYTIRGINRKVAKDTITMAIFGSFERVGDHVEYTATLIADRGQIAHSYDSELADDLIALRAGNVEIFQ